VDLDTFITTVFCLIDDWLKEPRIRRRGPAPKLADSEVLAIEVVGEFLGTETDKGLYDHFRRQPARSVLLACRRRVGRGTVARAV
jgi:hypothetical protein